MSVDLATANKRIAELEAWAKKAKARIAELEALIHEVKDHVDPAKKDIVLAIKTAKSWVARVAKLFKKIF